MLILGPLNAFSARFAERLFAIYPEWERLARNETGAHATPGCFVVEVPARLSSDRSLTIYTDNNEVTVCFSPTWHGHYRCWTGDEEKTAFNGALDDIAGILADQFVGVAWYRNGKATGGSLVSVDEIPAAPNAPDEVMRVISWSGRHDCV